MFLERAVEHRTMNLGIIFRGVIAKLYRDVAQEHVRVRRVILRFTRALFSFFGRGQGTPKITSGFGNANLRLELPVLMCHPVNAIPVFWSGRAQNRTFRLKRIFTNSPSRVSTAPAHLYRGLISTIFSSKLLRRSTFTRKKSLFWDVGQIH